MRTRDAGAKRCAGPPGWICASAITWRVHALLSGSPRHAPSRCGAEEEPNAACVASDDRVVVGRSAYRSGGARGLCRDVHRSLRLHRAASAGVQRRGLRPVRRGSRSHRPAHGLPEHGQTGLSAERRIDRRRVYGMRSGEDGALRRRPSRVSRRRVVRLQRRRRLQRAHVQYDDARVHAERGRRRRR